MTSETLYSDGNTGNGVGVNNAPNANGVQDGNFADADGGWAQNDNWEFTMQNTALTAALLARMASMVCNLRYYFGGALGLGDVFDFDIHDGVGWTTLETFDALNSPEGLDPGKYVENYDLSGILDTVAKLNAAEFRFIKTDAIVSVNTIHVDSIRIVTYYDISGKRLVGLTMANCDKVGTQLALD